jgi:hypothetical protein
MNPPVPEVTVLIHKIVKDRRAGEYRLHIKKVLGFMHWDKRRQKPKRVLQSRSVPINLRNLRANVPELAILDTVVHAFAACSLLCIYKQRGEVPLPVVAIHASLKNASSPFTLLWESIHSSAVETSRQRRRMKMKLFTIPLLIALLSAGCNSGKKVEAQSRAAEPAAPVPTPAKPEAVETQPTMFEWRGVHNGMPIAEFQEKIGRNCGEDKGIDNCSATDTAVISDHHLELNARYYRETAPDYRHGQIYRFFVLCDDDESCRTILEAVEAHFGRPTELRHKWAAVRWESSLELAQYKPPQGINPFGMVIVCSPELSPAGQCNIF